MQVTATQPGAASEVSAIKPKANPSVFWKLVGFTLRDYFRTPWVFLNLAILVLLHTLFFQYQSGQSHFFGIEYAAVIAWAGITTAVMLARANRAETYAILARQVTRASYTGAIMLSAWLVAALFYIVSMLFDYLRFSQLVTGQAPLAWRIPNNYLLGSLPELVVAAFAVCIVALLSSFVSGSWIRLFVMALIALLVMSFDSHNFPLEFMRPLLQMLPPVLAPIAGALKFTCQQDNIAVVSLGLLAGYTVLLVIIVLALVSGRELVLD